MLDILDQEFLVGLTIRQCILYASVAINLSVLFVWVRRRFSLSRCIEGRWTGILTREGHKVPFECILVITVHRDRQNHGVFYYSQYCPDGTTTQGMDELDWYPDDGWSVRDPKWTPRFARLFHVEFNHTGGGKHVDDGKPLYNWDCKFAGLWTKPRMNVSLEGNDARFEGVLHKT